MAYVPFHRHALSSEIDLFSREKKRGKKGKASLQQQQKQRRAVRHSTIGLPSLACVHSSTVYKVLFHSKDFGVGQIILEPYNQNMYCLVCKVIFANSNVLSVIPKSNKVGLYLPI